jgi:predicted SnoaL-like aldol condensation-catalyzing enzyme
LTRLDVKHSLPAFMSQNHYKMNENGKAIEHWDVLREVGDPKEATHANGMF